MLDNSYRKKQEFGSNPVLCGDLQQKVSIPVDNRYQVRFVFMNLKESIFFCILDWQDFSFEEVRWEYYMKKNLNQEHLYVSEPNLPSDR